LLVSFHPCGPPPLGVAPNRYFFFLTNGENVRFIRLRSALDDRQAPKRSATHPFFLNPLLRWKKCLARTHRYCFFKGAFQRAQLHHRFVPPPFQFCLPPEILARFATSAPDFCITFQHKKNFCLMLTLPVLPNVFPPPPPPKSRGRASFGRKWPLSTSRQTQAPPFQSLNTAVRRHNLFVTPPHRACCAVLLTG